MLNSHCCAAHSDTSIASRTRGWCFLSQAFCILAFPASPQQDTEYQSAKLRTLPRPRPLSLSFPTTFTDVKKLGEGVQPKRSGRTHQ